MRRLLEPDSVFMAVFCIFALLLWLTIIGGGGRLIETLQQDSTWVWPNRLGILAQTVGVLLVIAQLRIILKEQERTTAALLRGPRLRLGVTERDIDGELRESVTVTATPHPTAGHVMELRILTENVGEKSAHYLKWTVRSEPRLAHWDVAIAAWNDAKREYDPDGGDRFEFGLDALHPTERQVSRLRADTPELTPFDVLVRVAMETRRL